MNNSLKTPVKNFLNWEKKKGKDTFLVQPIDGEYIEFTWERVGNEARKMCNYINSLNLPKKSKIGVFWELRDETLSKKRSRPGDFKEHTFEKWF